MKTWEVIKAITENESFKFEDENENTLTCLEGWLYHNNNFIELCVRETRKEGAWAQSNGPYTLYEVQQMCSINNDYTFRNNEGDRIYVSNGELITIGRAGGSVVLNSDWYKED